MQSEEQYKVNNKRQKSTTAQQSAGENGNYFHSKKTSCYALKTTPTPHFAPFESRNLLPTRWAEHTERENSGFSV